MNRKKENYDTHSVGNRIRSKRITLGLSQEELAERIDRAPKYYSDIERGSCGMSVETMLSISKALDISLDYMMFGTPSKEEIDRIDKQESALTHIIAQCEERKYNYATRLLQLFIASMSSEEEKKQ